MDSLLPYLRNWFLERDEHLSVFAAADSRIEGWFKAECLVLFTRLTRKGQIDKFEREVNVAGPADGKRNPVDFRLQFQGKTHLCELKALCISQAARTPRNLRFYFRDDNVGLIRDFKKLDDLSRGNRWVLAFVYPSPDLGEWKSAIASLPSELRHWQPVTNPPDFPKSVFISLWKG